MRTVARRVVSGAFATAALVSTAEARAVDAEVESSTMGQTYQVFGVQGTPLLTRRRITQTIGLGVYHLTDDSASDAPQLFFRARLRMDADFGESREEYSIAARDPSRFVPGLQPLAPVDLMYGYVEGRRFARGLLGFKLGRQYVVDPLGFYAFDGALARITTPAYFAIELYGGLEVRAGMPLSSGRWELGGIPRGPQSDVNGMTGASPYPRIQEARLAPVYAIAVESAGPSWIHGRFTYRKAFNTGQSYVAGPAGPFVPGVGRTLGVATWDGQARVSSERIGYGMNVDFGEVASARGSITYDLYTQKVASAEVGTDWFLSSRVTLGADYTYFRPIFDADSIFNFFVLDPMDDVAARIEVDPTDRLELEADAMVRRYRSDDVSDASRVASSYAPGGGLRARYRLATARLTARTQALHGDQGDRYGGDLIFDKSFFERWLATGRLSLWHFGDNIRVETDGRSRTVTSFGYVLGGGYRFATDASAFVQLEQDFNRLLGARLRVLAVLSFRAGT